MNGFSLLHQILHHLRHRFRLHLRVYAMLKIKINVIRFQPFQRTFHRLTNHFRSGICNQRNGHFAVLVIKSQAKFSRNDHFVPYRGEGFSHQFLIDVRILLRTVNLRSIKKSIPKIKRPAKQADCFLFLCRRSISMGKAHTSQPDGGNRQCLSQSTCFHSVLLLPSNYV